MTKRTLAAALCAVCLLSLAACGGKAADPETTKAPDPSEATAEPSPDWAGGQAPESTQKPHTPSPSPKPTASPSPKPAVPAQTPGATVPPTAPLSDGEISARFEEAIAAMETTVTLNVSGREWKYGAENDLKNLYYAVLSERPELKYAYDLTASVTGGTAKCVFSYMPYKTGAYASSLPAGSHAVGSLHDADVMAQSMTDGTERLSIAITDPSLQVEALQRAAGQAGYGWMVCTLSRDGTELLATPTQGRTLGECAAAIGETFRLAGEVLGKVVSDGMTDREKAEAAYSYITENVAYDFRYYSGKGDMPFESTTALGALRDGLAICGGYSHALETLLDMCGIENYTVSGVSHGEDHAWNYVVLDGEGYYCDPTADRGGMKNRFLLTAAELEALGGYQWDDGFYRSLRA